MMAQIIKKRKDFSTKNYIVLAVIIITQFFSWLYLRKWNPQDTMGKLTPFILLATLVILVFIILKQRNRPNFEVSETEIKNLKTNSVTQLKNIEEVIITAVSKNIQLNTLMFRSQKNEKFNVVSLHHYSENAIEIFMQNYVPARSKEIVKQLQEGKTITFKQRSIAKFNNKVIALTKTDLKIEEKTFRVIDLLPIKIGNSLGNYEIHEKQRERIFTFSD